MIIKENNQNKQGGWKLKNVDYCLQYGTGFHTNEKLLIQPYLPNQWYQPNRFEKDNKLYIHSTVIEEVNRTTLVERG